MQLSQIPDDKPEETNAAISELFTTKIDEIIDSFFEYARDLARSDIEEVASDGEIVTAFMGVFESFVVPFGELPQEMLKKVSQ